FQIHDCGGHNLVSELISPEDDDGSYIISREMTITPIATPTDDGIESISNLRSFLRSRAQLRKKVETSMDPKTIESFLCARSILHNEINTASNNVSRQGAIPKSKSQSSSSKIDPETIKAKRVEREADKILDGMCVTMRTISTQNAFMLPLDGTDGTDNIMTLGDAKAHKHRWTQYEPNAGNTEVPAPIRKTVHQELCSELSSARMGNKEPNLLRRLDAYNSVHYMG
ncbi:unnamed protein product, partial [marine sediment metagenome]